MDGHIVLRAAMHLGMEELARWRTVDTATKAALDVEGEENAWRFCAEAQFSFDKLFAPYSLYAREQRELCFKFHSLLPRANYMMSSDALFVEDIEEADLIERRLREALCDCSTHRAASGRDAQVLLGSFCLRGAKETMFQFGGEKASRGIAGLPPGVLAMKLRVHQGVVMAWAAYGSLNGNVMEMCQEAACVQLAMNICSTDPEVSLAFRGLLVLDGRWRSWEHSTSHCKCSQNYANWPVLCALTLFAVAPREERLGLADALNLERL